MVARSIPELILISQCFSMTITMEKSEQSCQSIILSNSFLEELKMLSPDQENLLERKDFRNLLVSHLQEETHRDCNSSRSKREIHSSVDSLFDTNVLIQFYLNFIKEMSISQVLFIVTKSDFNGKKTYGKTFE